MACSQITTTGDGFEQAKADGVGFDNTPAFVLRHPDTQALTGWEAEP